VIGERLGHYEILEELGRGGMGVVYLARQDGLDRLVAVKVLAAMDAELAARLRREARVLSELHHPHIVSIYDLGEVAGNPYFVMAYCAGGSVTDVLAQQGSLTVGQAVNVLAATSSALSAMHSLGLVHRDVKPSNVLLSADGQPFLSDLGIVGGEERSRMTATGSLVGTLGYSAPELLDNAHHSPACDTFSLGVLGYEIISGRQPFVGRSLSGVLDAVRRGVYPPLAEVAHGVPAALAELISSAMSLDPAQRPADLEQFSHAFLTVARPERVRAIQHDSPTEISVARTTAPSPALETTPNQGNISAQGSATRIRVAPLLDSSEPPPPPEPAARAPGRLSRRLVAGAAAVALVGVAAAIAIAHNKDNGSPPEGAGVSGSAPGFSVTTLPAMTDESVLEAAAQDYLQFVDEYSAASDALWKKYRGVGGLFGGFSSPGVWANYGSMRPYECAETITLKKTFISNIETLQGASPTVGAAIADQTDNERLIFPLYESCIVAANDLARLADNDVAFNRFINSNSLAKTWYANRTLRALGLLEI